MTLSEIKTLTRFFTKTDSTSFADSDILTLTNEIQKDLIAKILRNSTDINLGVKESKTNLVAYSGLSEGDNGYNGEYAFPSDFVKPVRMEIHYSDNQYPLKAKIYDLNDNSYSEYDSTDIQKTFDKNEPYVRFERNSYFIRPLPETSVTNGIRVWYEARQADLSGDTDKPAMIEDYHLIFPFKISELYGIRESDNYKQNQIQAWRLKAFEIEDEMLKFYKNQFKRNFTINPKVDSYA